MKVMIVMATYNGERYISDQLDSLLAQDFGNILILIHDDGSTDGTQEIIKAYACKHPEKIMVLDAPPSGGACKNFSLLLVAALAMEKNNESVYFMCADQDDLWAYNKISSCLKIMLDYEKTSGKSIPVLIHTDLELINSRGQKLSNSFFAYQNLDPNWGNSFPKILTQNVVTGCTILMNKRLLEIALPIPANAIMHDWWLALVACSFGEIVYFAMTSVKYRQHDFNILGAKKFDFSYVIRKALTFWLLKDRQQSLYYSALQAREFSLCYPSSPQRKIAEEFSSLMEAGYIAKKIIIVTNKFYKIGWQRQIAWLLLT